MPLPYATPFLNNKWENKTLNINFMFFIIFIFIGCWGSCQQWLPQCPDRRNGSINVEFKFYEEFNKLAEKTETKWTNLNGT